MNITCHHRHVCTGQKHTPLSVYNRTPSPFWLKCRCFPASFSFFRVFIIPMKLLVGCTYLMVAVPAVFALEARTPFLQPNASRPSVAIPVDLQVLAENCQCSFTGFCGCASTVQLMSCFANTCEGGFHFLKRAKCWKRRVQETRLTCLVGESVCRDGSELMTVHIERRQTHNGLIAKGSPVVATTTPADAVNSSGRHIISDIREAQARDWMRAFSALIVQNLLHTALVVICAFIYNRRPATFWRKKTPAAPSGDFHYGLFGCCRDRRTRWLSLLVCCCWPLRWADSMDKATNLQTAPLMESWEPDGYQDWLPSFWRGVVIMVGDVFISPLSAGLWGLFFCIYGAFARRQVRQKLEMHDRGAVQVMEDFCSLSVHFVTSWSNSGLPLSGDNSVQCFVVFGSCFSFQRTSTRPCCSPSFCRCSGAVMCCLLVSQQLDGRCLGSRPLCWCCKARVLPFPVAVSGIS